MRFSVRSLKIRQQIVLVTLPPLFSLLVAIGLSFFTYWMAGRINLMDRVSYRSMARTESVIQHLTEADTAVESYLYTGQQSYLGLYELSMGDMESDLLLLQSLAAQSGGARDAEIKSLEGQINLWKADWADPAIARARLGMPFDQKAVVVDGAKRVNLMRAELQGLVETYRTETLSRQVGDQQLLSRMLTLGVSLTALLALLLIFLMRAVTRWISQPVNQLIEASVQVSQGDLRPALPPPSENEFGSLSQSFSRMTSALQREREEMAALNKFSEAVTQCTTEGEVYEHVLHSLKERFEPRQVIVFRLNASENFMEVAATLVSLPAHLAAWPVIDEPHDCKAIRIGRRFCVNDVTLQPLCPAKFAPPGEGSYCCAPLIAGGILIGAVRLEGPKDFWTADRESLFESYLSGAATALSNLRLLTTMKRQANVDELTGLYNRRFLDDYARKLIAMASRRNTQVGLIMMDLDHFKTFNDTYGHEAGDRILRHFSKTVTETMRETNLAARHGGEEFVVLLPDITPQAVVGVAERIRRAVQRMVVPSNSDKPFPPITVSLGISIFPDHGKTLEELLSASDKALYESKRAGRNRATLYDAKPEVAS